MGLTTGTPSMQNGPCTVGRAGGGRIEAVVEDEGVWLEMALCALSQISRLLNERIGGEREINEDVCRYVRLKGKSCFSGSSFLRRADMSRARQHFKA